MEIIILGFWLLCGIGAAMIASSKGRSGCGWFAAGVLFGPIALLIVGFMAPASARVMAPAERRDARYEKKCPYCAEVIKAEARVCRYCGRDLPAESVVVEPPKTRQLTRSDYASLSLAQQVGVRDHGVLLPEADAQRFAQLLGNLQDAEARRFAEENGERVIYRG